MLTIIKTRVIITQLKVIALKTGRNYNELAKYSKNFRIIKIMKRDQM